MTVLFGWGPAFGCHSPSPYVMKTMIHLDMLGVDYTTQMADLKEAPFGRAPYIKDDGKIVAESAFIRHYFEEKLGKDLDANLSGEQRAIAWSMERMIESDMGLMLLNERWLKSENFDKGPAFFFAQLPEEVRAKVIESSLEGIEGRVNSNGFRLLPEKDRIFLFERCVSSLSAQLADNAYMFGDEPTGLDAVVAAFIVSCGTEFFDTPMRGVIDKYPNLQALVKRIDARFFNVEKWDAA